MTTLMDDQPQGRGSRYKCKFQNCSKLQNSNSKSDNHYNEYELCSDYDNLIRMNSELYGNEISYSGVVVLTNNSIHTTNQIYNDKCHDESQLEINYMKVILPASTGYDNACTVNRTFLKVYDIKGLSSHILSMNAEEGHGADLGSIRQQSYLRKVKLSIFDDILLCTGMRVKMV